jgi:hypothetical protein
VESTVHVKTITPIETNQAPGDIRTSIEKIAMILNGIGPSSK